MSQSVLLGGVAGLLATVAMTLVWHVLGDDPPLTAYLWAKFIQEDSHPEDVVLPGLALHLIYGVSVGMMFTIGVAQLGWSASVAALLAGMGYGVALGLGGGVVWVHGVLELDLDTEFDLPYGAAHAVYGLVLGALAAFPPL